MGLFESAKHAAGQLLHGVRAGNRKLACAKLNLFDMARLDISSSELQADARIPTRYTADGQNISPPLKWSGIPAEAKELLLLCEDPDAPKLNPFVHWIMFHIPLATS